MDITPKIPTRPDNYVYGLFDPRLPLSSSYCRYIGKTVQRLSTRLNKHISEAANGDGSHRCHWIRTLLRDGVRPIALVLEVVANESDLDACEVQWIAHGSLLGWRLTNGTDGGDGGRHTEEAKAKTSQTLKGHPVSEETRQKLTGRVVSDETKEILRQTQTGKRATDAARTKMSASQRKRPPMSEETKAKISASKMGHPTSDATRLAITESNRRRKGSHHKLKN